MAALDVANCLQAIPFCAYFWSDGTSRSRPFCQGVLNSTILLLPVPEVIRFASTTLTSTSVWHERFYDCLRRDRDQPPCQGGLRRKQIILSKPSNNSSAKHPTITSGDIFQFVGAVDMSNCQRVTCSSLQQNAGSC